MNLHKTILTFSILAMIFGCTPVNITSSTPANPTETNTLATHIPLPAPSETLLPDTPDGCVRLRNTPIDSDVLTGLLVVRDSDNYSDHFFDPKLNQVLSIEEKKQISSLVPVPEFVFANISPNKKYLQTFFIDEDYGIIRTVDEVIKTYDTHAQRDWNRGRWLDNENMFFQYWSDVPDGLFSIVIYNPFTGEQKEMQFDLPNPYIVEDIGGRVSWVKADIDSTLKLVLYNDKDERLVLWDLDTKREIAHLPAPIDMTDGEWSPDGKKFVTSSPSSYTYTVPTELFTISMDGTVTKLTNFSQRYPFANISTFPSWSPDGRYIAYWLQISNITSANPDDLRQWLTITDTFTLDTKIYCLSPNVPSIYAEHIVWSPNSQQVIVNTDTLSEEVKPILVDLTNLTQSILNTHGLSVNDWMSP